jgi:plastocyanin
LASATLVPLLLLGGVPAEAAPPTLKGTVNNKAEITLTKGGKKVTTLKHGKYVIKVTDSTSMHNFHLTGKRLSKATSVSGTGTVSWTVTLNKGKYNFRCDVHPSMKGSFKVT